MTDRLDAIRQPSAFELGQAINDGIADAATAYAWLTHPDVCSPSPLALKAIDVLRDELASLRARVETAEQEIAAAVAVFHGDPPIPNEMTLVEKVQNVLAQLSEARTKQAEAEELAAAERQWRLAEVELSEYRKSKLAEERTKQAEAEAKWKTLHDNFHRETGLALSADGLSVFMDGAGDVPLKDVGLKPEAIDQRLTEERTRREQAEQEREYFKRQSEGRERLMNEAIADSQQNYHLTAKAEVERDTLQRDLDALRQQIADRR